jgi:hypothetical protein
MHLCVILCGEDGGREQEKKEEETLWAERIL